MPQAQHAQQLVSDRSDGAADHTDHRAMLIGEAKTILARVQEDVRLLVPADGIAHLEPILRSVHSYKSLAAFARLDTATRFATELEAYLSELWRGRLPLTGEAVSLVRRAVSAAVIIHSAQVTQSTADCTAILREIRNAIGESTTTTVEAAPDTRTDPVRKPEAEPLATQVDGRSLAEMEALSANSARLLDRLRESLAARAGERSQMMVVALDRNLRQLQQTAHRCRFTSVTELAEPAVSSIQEVAARFGKRVSLEVAGGEVEVERATAQALRPSLMHLLRNAVAHGAESGDARLATGKPEATTITISARVVEGRLLLAVADDGRGFDVGALRRRAVAIGAISPERGAMTDDREALRLAFVPGVSTAPTRNELSGTGMGLAAVVEDLAGLGGEVRLQSTLGAGTTVTLVLPVNEE